MGLLIASLVLLFAKAHDGALGPAEQGGQTKSKPATTQNAPTKTPASTQAGGGTPILQGKDVAGPVTLKFQLSSPVRYLATSTRRITGSGADLVASLKDYGFKEEAGEWTRARRWGVTVSPTTSGFEPVPGPVAAHAVLKFHREFFATGESNDWGSLFLENGAKVIQEGNSQQVHVGDSYWMLNGLYGSTPQYETRYYTTNKAGDASLPEEPFKMPGRVAVGDSIPVSVDDANGTLPALWRVSEIKEQDDTVFVAGRLKAVPGSAVKIDGTMVLRTDLGVVDRLKVQFSYPDGKWQGIGHGLWSYEVEYHLTDESAYDKVSVTEHHLFDNVSTNGPLQSRDVLEGRIVNKADALPVAGTQWSIKLVAKDGFRDFEATDGKGSSTGSWDYSGEHLVLSPVGSKDSVLLDANMAGFAPVTASLTSSIVTPLIESQGEVENSIVGTWTSSAPQSIPGVTTELSDRIVLRGDGVYSSFRGDTLVQVGQWKADANSFRLDAANFHLVKDKGLSLISVDERQKCWAQQKGNSVLDSIADLLGVELPGDFAPRGTWLPSVNKEMVGTWTARKYFRERFEYQGLEVLPRVSLVIQPDATFKLTEIWLNTMGKPTRVPERQTTGRVYMAKHRDVPVALLVGLNGNRYNGPGAVVLSVSSGDTSPKVPDRLSFQNPNPHSLWRKLQDARWILERE